MGGRHVADIRISFPVDLGKGREVTDEVAEQYFQHVEKDVARGFFPLGHNTVWHGGVHVYGGENTPVYAMFDGTVVAAKVATPADEAVKGFGSVNFLVVKHEVRGSALNSVAKNRKYKSSRYYTFYSLYMHLGSLDLAAGNAALAEIGWLTKPAGHELSGSVGAGGRNQKADVELVQTLLTHAGIECGPIDGGCGSKTINAIKTFQDTFLYSNPDGRIDVGGSSWKALQFAGLGTPSRDGMDEELLGKLAGGAALNPNKPIAGGQQLWVLGNDTPAKSTWMIQWEVFSEENLFDDFTAVADEGNYTADPTLIRSTLKADAWLPGNDITGQQVADFYASHPDAKKLREYVVKFRSEWAADLDAMMAALAKRFWTDGLRAELEPYMWYGEIQADADLPEPLHYHYNAIRFLQMLRDMEHRRELPPPPPPPPKADDDDEQGGGERDDVTVTQPDDEDVLLYDTQTKTFYVIPARELKRLVAEDAQLAKMADQIKAASDAKWNHPRDEWAKAVNPTLQQLRQLTNSVDAPQSPPQLKEYLFVPHGVNGGTGRSFRTLYSGNSQTAARIVNAAKKKVPGRNWESAKVDVGVELWDKTFGEYSNEVAGGNWARHWNNADLSADGKFLRFAAQAKGTAKYDLSGGLAEVKLSAGGSVSLLEGKVATAFFLPNRDGFKIQPSQGQDIYVRLNIFGEAGGFVGATAEIVGKGAFAWKPQPDDGVVGVNMEAGLEAFAGVKVEGKLGAKLEWYNSEDRGWKTLAEIAMSGTAAAGIGATLKFYLTIDAQGTFRVFFKAELVVKVGFGTGVEAKIVIMEVIDFVWTLLKMVDWGRILEMSFEAFIKASELILGTAMAGVMGPAGIGIYLLRSFWSWWDDQDKITDLANNILNNKAPYLLNKGTPEAKGMAIYRLTQASWMWDETSETASLKVLKSARNKREAEKILKSIDPKGRDENASAADRTRARTVQRGYDLLSGLVDWAEQTELDNYLAGLGISVS
ncbi:MAG: hypothetical protein H6702_22755 [Myxococcales bacterium]|nr:hypothetical protein [Myxococcales bacterium]